MTQPLLLQAALRAWVGLIAALALALPSLAQADSHTADFDRNWAFRYDPGSTLNEARASEPIVPQQWTPVALPHTWSTYETTGDRHPFIRAASERIDPYWWMGWGWYRKSFAVTADLSRQRLYVEFDGVQKIARVFVNGREVSQHLGGYAPFSIDLTDHVRTGGPNEIAVAVSNRRQDEIGVPPMNAGNFNVYGGIYRSVRLVLRDNLHVPPPSGQADGGQWIRTPSVSAASGSVWVRTWLRNSAGVKAAARVRTRILGPDGRVLQERIASSSIEPGALVPVDQDLGSIARPRLWSPEQPVLYRVLTDILVGSRVVDTQQSFFGFRWFRWDRKRKTLVLNDVPVSIRGMNRHQEYPWLGDAVPRWLHLEELSQMRAELGVNFLRAAHYPNDPAVYAETDRLGIITVVEVPNIKSIAFNRDAQRQQLTEMIRSLRNHPSIVFWSVGNETNQPVDSCLARELDPDRIIHARKAANAGACVDHDHRDLDLESLLRVTIRGWDTADAVPGGEGRPLQSRDGQTASPEDWAHQMARVDDGSVRGRIDRPGVAWLFADHGADRTYANAPLDNVNAKGFVDIYRIPKTIYGLWQANWSRRPVLKVHDTYWRREFLGTRQSIVVDSNCDKVTLSVGGKTVGFAAPRSSPQRTVTFPGVLVENRTLEARCSGAQKLRAAIEMAGTPYALTLTSHHRGLVADRRSIAIITAGLIDKRGISVRGARPPLTWSVEGEATLVGMPNYTSQAGDLLSPEGSGYIALPVRNVIRTTRRPGRIIVTVASPGVRPARLIFNSIPDRGTRARWLKEAETGAVAPALRARERDYDRFAAVRASAPSLRRLDNENVRFAEVEAGPLRAALGHFLFERNPTLTTGSAMYRALVDEMVAAIKRTDGWLIPDDFNLLAQRFNDGMVIEGMLRTGPFTPQFRDRLNQHFADEIIRKGRPADSEHVAARLANLRPANTVIEIGRLTDQGVTVNDGELAADLIARIYPAAPPEEKARMLDELIFWNPHLFDAERGVKARLPISRSGEVLLIPGQVP